MREILYKAKDIDTGKWVEGYYTRAYFAGKHVHYINAHEFKMKYGSTRYEYVYQPYQIDPSTLCQWTGLVDKNGVKVFEGDIIESIFTKKPYIVCFGEYKCINEYDEEKYEYGWYNVDEGWFRTAFARPDEWGIVIGSIHDKEVEE